MPIRRGDSQEGKENLTTTLSCKNGRPTEQVEEARDGRKQWLLFFARRESLGRQFLISLD